MATKQQKLRDLEWKLAFVESGVSVNTYIKVYKKLLKKEKEKKLSIN